MCADGSRTRSFCYVSDTVTAILLMAGKDGLATNVLNLASRDETRIIGLAQDIVTPSSSPQEIVFRPFPPEDHKRRLPEISKARTVIQWSPRVGLKRGLERTYQWFSNKKRC